jgi:hypothetical protein
VSIGPLPFPSAVLIRASIGAVWLYEGLWCKLLGRTPSQVQVVSAVPRFGASFGAPFLKALGVLEVLLALWAFSGIAPADCAIAQIAILITLNINGLLWARAMIHEPIGMVFKNAAFLVLVWISGGLPGTGK